MVPINYTSERPLSGTTTVKILLNLGTGTVDLGAGNGRILRQHRLECAGIMVQEDFPTEYRHCAGKISAWIFADTKKDK